MQKILVNIPIAFKLLIFNKEIYKLNFPSDYSNFNGTNHFIKKNKMIETEFIDHLSSK